MGEYRATRAALARIPAQDVGKGDLLRVRAGDLDATLSNLQGTYFLRLAAEAERAMRVHLRTHFPAQRLTKRDTFHTLVERVTKHFDPTDPAVRMPTHLVSATLSLIAYRNGQAHGLDQPITHPSIDKAVQILSQFLYSLP